MRIPFPPLLLSIACTCNADRVANISDGGGDLTLLLQLNVEVHPNKRRHRLLIDAINDSAPMQPLPGRHVSQRNFYLNTQASTSTSEDPHLFAKLRQRYKDFREGGLLATLMAKAMAALMVFKVLIDCIERYLTDLPVCSCVAIMCLIFVFIKTLIGTLWLLDEEFRRKLGDWSIVGCVYVCASLMCVPFCMFVPSRENAKNMSERWLPGIFKKASDPQRKQWTVRCFFGLFVAKGISTLAIFRLFEVQNEVWGERMNSITDDQVLQGVGASASGIPAGQSATPYLITLIYLTLARCSLAVIYERLIKEDSVLDMPAQLYAYIVEGIRSEFIDEKHTFATLQDMVLKEKAKVDNYVMEHLEESRREIKDKTDKIMTQLIASCKSDSKSGVDTSSTPDSRGNRGSSGACCGVFRGDCFGSAAAVSGRRRGGSVYETSDVLHRAQKTQNAAENALPKTKSATNISQSTANLANILESVICSSFMIQARIKGSQTLTVACAIALNQNRAQQDIERAVKHLTSCFDPKHLTPGTKLQGHLRKILGCDAQQMLKFMLRHVDQFGKTIVEELRHTIVDVLCSFRIGSEDLGTELENDWHRIKEEAMAGNELTLADNCKKLARRVVEKLAEINLFGIMRSEVDNFIDRKIDGFEEHIHREIEEMSTKLTKLVTDQVQRLDFLPHYLDKMLSTAHVTQDTASILSQKSNGLSTLLQTVDDLLEMLPDAVQQSVWWFYSIGVLCLGGLANLLICKAIYMLGLSPPTITLAILGVISNTVCFAFWIWASTGRLNEMDGH